VTLDSAAKAAIVAQLTARPRALPSWLLYDTLGSALFDAICELPWYPITRAERQLLEAHGSEILRGAGHRLIELGPGDGSKLALLLEQTTGALPPVALVDLSASALETARLRMVKAGVTDISVHHADYLVGLQAAVATRTGPCTVLFLGSNIGNLSPADAAAFLGTIASSLGAGDQLVLGTDMAKSETELLLAYDDPLGVTAAFNRNLLVRLNRELGANFDVDGFAHRAVWNADEFRVEMHLVSACIQRVTIPGVAPLDFIEGETIWTESSYKYDVERINAMLQRAGFAVKQQWVGAGFCETVAMKL
jgi:L-histidine N-alpha-methyltransferase